jgi:hypothetical protein
VFSGGVTFELAQVGSATFLGASTHSTDTISKVRSLVDIQHGRVCIDDGIYSVPEFCRPVLCVLMNIFPADTMTPDRFERVLRKRVTNLGGTFVDFDAIEGRWSFIVLPSEHARSRV